MRLSEIKLEIVKQSKRVLKSKVPTRSSTLKEVENNLIHLFNDLTVQSKDLLNQEVTEQQKLEIEKIFIYCRKKVIQTFVKLGLNYRVSDEVGVEIVKENTLTEDDAYTEFSDSDSEDENPNPNQTLTDRIKGFFSKNSNTNNSKTSTPTRKDTNPRSTNSNSGNTSLTMSDTANAIRMVTSVISLYDGSYEKLNSFSTQVEVIKTAMTNEDLQPLAVTLVKSRITDTNLLTKLEDVDSLTELLDLVGTPCNV